MGTRKRGREDKHTLSVEDLKTVGNDGEEPRFPVTHDVRRAPRGEPR